LILYNDSLEAFKCHVDSNQIVDMLVSEFHLKLGYRPSPSEQNSWNHSLRFMETAARRAELPGDCGVLVEYKIPTTSKRIDFMLTGQNEDEEDHFVLVELKQWSEANKSKINNLVNTFIGGAHRDVLHPSFQVLTYEKFLSHMNEGVHRSNIIGKACVYLHNFKKRDPEPLLDDSFQDFTSSAPVFFKDDIDQLQLYLKRFLSKGNGKKISYIIEGGKLRPSKKLMDTVVGLFKGNEEFILLDEQVVAYETIVHECLSAGTGKKVVVVEGGPGTGKSVVSMNVFGKILGNNKNVVFVAPNAAFRDTMVAMLSKGKVGTQVYLKNLFKGSSAFVDVPESFYEAIIVDEAHRLKGKGTYMYRGQNQVEDIISSAKVSVFFIDDAQQVRPDDIGSTHEIRKIAQRYNAQVMWMKLKTQFRCSGAEGYINWITDVLQIEDTANAEGWDIEAYDFRILDTPQQVQNLIKAKSQESSARMLGGYAWPWTSIKNGNLDAEIDDVVIEEHDFKMPWNSRRIGSAWATQTEGVDQLGCIHTSQGLEFDYVGVLFGNDIRFDPETNKVYADYSSYYDNAGKKNLRDEPEKLTEYIQNIYKVLCTRGMKGCYIYVRDNNFREYMKSRLQAARKNTYKLRRETRYSVVAEEQPNYEV
jgi:DUF2075 family protein